MYLTVCLIAKLLERNKKALKRWEYLRATTSPTKMKEQYTMNIKSINKKIHCCGCLGKVDAILIKGEKVYPHRADLYELSFWECPTCLNFVGCHKHDKNHQPLGCIPTPEIKKLRQQIHKKLDPLWQSGNIKRSYLYNKLTDLLGFKYHTASLRTVDECERTLMALFVIEGEM